MLNSPHSKQTLHRVTVLLLLALGLILLASCVPGGPNTVPLSLQNRDAFCTVQFNVFGPSSFSQRVGPSQTRRVQVLPGTYTFSGTFLFDTPCACRGTTPLVGPFNVPPTNLLWVDCLAAMLEEGPSTPAAGAESAPAELLQELIPGIRETLKETGGEDVVLTPDRIKVIEALLDDYAKQASPEQQATIEQIRKQLRDFEGKTLQEAWESISADVVDSE